MADHLSKGRSFFLYDVYTHRIIKQPHVKLKVSWCDILVVVLIYSVPIKKYRSYT
jgi:hypothetical protein